MRAGCRGLFFLLCLPAIFTSLGCRNKTDVLESEIRARDVILREALDEQRRNEAQIMALHREVEAIRKGAKITPEQAAQTFGLKRIVLGRSTGGFDNDGLPGDELLQVVVEPRDLDDHSIKAPGLMQILALEISPQGTKTPLCQWDIPPEQLSRNWKQGLLSTGYTLTLGWKTFPSTEQVRVVVRFITPDQRVYEADKDIKVRVVPGAVPRPTMPEAIPAPPMPESGPTLVPTTRVVPVPHTTQWRPLPEVGVTVDQKQEIGVTVGRPQPIE